MGVDILMKSAGFTTCSTPSGDTGFMRALHAGDAVRLVVFSIRGNAIHSPYDPVRCCYYDSENDMLSEQLFSSLFDLLESQELALQKHLQENASDMS